MPAPIPATTIVIKAATTTAKRILPNNILNTPFEWKAPKGFPCLITH
jgi:hypothetical protein